MDREGFRQAGLDDGSMQSLLGFCCCVASVLSFSFTYFMFSCALILTLNITCLIWSNAHDKKSKEIKKTDILAGCKL